MLQDRYVKAVLTVIAVALSAMAMAQLDSRGVASAGEVDVDTEGDDGSHRGRVPARESAGPVEQAQELAPSSAARAPMSTLPLRWRIAAAVEHTVSANDCTTVLDVTNATDAAVSVEVEWLDDFTGSLAVVPSTIPAFEQHTFLADDEVSTFPWLHLGGLVADLDDFDGYALVAADDPRIFVHAAIICRDDAATPNIVGLYGSPVFPVGTTADFFQAGSPGAAPMPPVARVSEPES